MKKLMLKPKFIILFIIATNISLYADEKLTIIYTNSLNGNIDYCHCKESPKGGLVKRGTVIKQLRRKNKNLLLFETGDFFHFENDPILAKYIISSYKYMKYDGISIGDQEFSIGIKNFIKYKNSIPFLSNNIKLDTGRKFKTYFKRYRIIKKNNIKIGIIGTIAKKVFKYYPVKLKSKILISNQIKEIQKDIKSLKKSGVDLIILLSHSGYDVDKKLAKSILNLDVIIGGHSQTLIKKPKKYGRSIIVQAGADGARIGILKLTLKNKKIIKFKNSFKRPDEHHPEDDKYIRNLINKYIKESKKSSSQLRFD